MKNLEVLLDMLEKCESVEQNLNHHPEGNVLNHSLQVFKHAIRESNDFELVLAALLHDVGKQVSNYGHDEIGSEMIKEYVSEKVYWLVKEHMRFWYFIDGEMKKFKKVQNLVNSEYFKDLVLLARWDKMGRNPNIKINYNRQDLLSKLKILNI
ncbi:MAG: HD domain-containing protein [Bacilli bacterium]